MLLVNRSLLVASVVTTLILAVLSVAPAKAASVLFVVGTNPPAVGSSDANIKLRLESFGNVVTAILAPISVTGDAAGKDAVLISSTCTSGDVAAKFANVPSGVMSWEQAILQQSRQNLITEAAARNSDGLFTQLTITAAGAAHPLGAGLAAGTYTVTNVAGPYSWGDSAGLGAGGIGVALRGDASGVEATHLGIIGYDTAALRPDGTLAPGRRVGFFLADATFNDLSPTGVRLFDAAAGYIGATIPEPSSGLFLGMSVVGLLGLRRRHSE